MLRCVAAAWPGVFVRGEVTAGATAVQPISISRALRPPPPPSRSPYRLSSTIGVTVRRQSVALRCRVSRRGGSLPATRARHQPPKLGVAQTQHSSDGLPCAVLPLFLKRPGLREAAILVQQPQDSRPTPPPPHARSQFIAVVSFTLLIKPQSESEATVVAFVKCQLPCAAGNAADFFRVGTLGQIRRINRRSAPAALDS